MTYGTYLKRARSEVIQWNSTHEPGETVEVNINEKVVKTRTLSVAFVMSATAVIRVEGISNPIPLSSIKTQS